MIKKAIANLIEVVKEQIKIDKENNIDTTEREKLLNLLITKYQQGI